MGSVLDKIQAAFPLAKVYVMQIWGRGTLEAGSTLIDDTYIPNVLSSRSSFAFLGGDERVFLKGSDDGASETIDGVHPTALGYHLMALAWQAAMGY